MTARAGAWPAVAAMLFAASLVLFWPGIATYDTVAQYGQVVSGIYDDWHPPVMARLWALLAPLGPGAAPMLAVQLALYWLGLGLIAAALARIGQRGRAAVVIAIGLWPLFLGWQGVVLKDAQLVAAMLAASGIVAWFRLQGRAIPLAAIAALVPLLSYAVLVRANAVFAVAPFVALLLPVAPWRRAGAAVILVAAVLAVAGPVNHRLFGAQSSGVEKTQPIYDLSGIAVRAGAGATPLDRAAVATLVVRHCVKPFFWDPLGDPAHCDATVEPLRRMRVGALYAAWAGAAAAHPLAYAEHRLAHLNATERWLVGDPWPSAHPPDHSEAAALGPLTAARPIQAWQALAGAIARTPAGWPICWVVLGLALLPMLDARPGARLAMALLGSALALEASFAVVSIASDLRYHLWPMIAVALAAVLAWRRPLPRRTIAALGVLAAVTVAGGVARAVLPEPPQTYSALLG